MCKRITPAFVLFAGLAMILLTGCGDGEKSPSQNGGDTKTGAAGDDPDDKPVTEEEEKALKASIKDYRDAVARIKSYRDTIRRETTEGKPSRAHRSLDELTLVLGWLGEFAQGSGVPKAKLVDVAKSAQSLGDAFEEVHKKIDARQKPYYAAVSATIEAEIKTLEGFTPAP
jgi:hypothetical protein